MTKRRGKIEKKSPPPKKTKTKKIEPETSEPAAATEPEEKLTSEDWCFVCKDGGLLIVCDHKDCIKSYHPDCVGKEESFVDAGEDWICDWHSCYVCQKSSKIKCICCPKAVCRSCLRGADFAPLKGQKGLCDECLMLALLVEEGLGVDSDGEKVDLKDRETYEGLFREYWEIINETEGFTLEDLHSADARLRKGEKRKSNSHLSDSDSDEYAMNGEKQEASSDDNGSEDHGSEDHGSEDDEKNEPARKANRSKASLKGHKGSAKIEFVGWASKSLLDFLTSIGKDTDKQLTQDDVESIIVKYVQENRLFHPEKKKKVVCDARLRSLLGRKLISVYKINDLLEAHFVENLELSEEDELEHGFEDDRENDSSPFDKRNWSSYKPCQQKESVTKKDQIKETKSGCFNAGSSPTEISISRFASVVPKNIKLVYLKRSLVEEMLKLPESFECKVVGTFVRVKSATIDCKHSHQLQQVTGIERTSLDEVKTSVLLKVSNIPDDIPISMLSNDDFSEEECEDLRQRIKNGFLEKLTVVELEKKARSLHEDITKHWIAKELVLLKHRIDLANEKGWRSKLFEYLERREMLESPEEQSQLLKEVPKVIPEIIELSPTPEDSPHDDGLEKLAAQEATIEQRLENPSSQDTKASFTIGTGDGDVSRSFISKIVNASLKGSVGKEKEANGAIAAQNDKKFVTFYRRQAVGRRS